MRRPAKLERAGALTPRDRMWAAIRRIGVGVDFSVAEIMVLTRSVVDGKVEMLCASTVLPYLEGLSNANPPFIYDDQSDPREWLPREFRRYRLERDVGAHAPNVRRDGTPALENIGQQQMWNAARKSKGPFTWIDVKQCCPVNPTMGTVKGYLKFLGRAGYLRTISEGKGGRPSVFQFQKSRDTGARPPMITANKEVMDANTGQIVLSGKGAAHAE